MIPVSLRFKERICDENGLLPMTSFIGYLALPKAANKEFQAILCSIVSLYHAAFAQ
ncbi:MAG: hypothetical protein IPP51_17925 [Bacteroidetes bacterium]|nr:hypothetical protein [Bacteroidota bacterium]